MLYIYYSGLLYRDFSIYLEKRIMSKGLVLRYNVHELLYYAMFIQCIVLS